MSGVDENYPITKYGATRGLLHSVDNMRFDLGSGDGVSTAQTWVSSAFPSSNGLSVSVGSESIAVPARALQNPEFPAFLDYGNPEFHIFPEFRNLGNPE